MIKKSALILAGFTLFFSGFIFSGENILASEVKLYGADASFEDKDLTLEEMLVYTLESQYITKYMNNSIIGKFGSVRPYDTLIENNKKNTSALNYSVSSIPTLIFINKDGYVVDTHVGALSKSMLESKIEKIR